METGSGREFRRLSAIQYELQRHAGERLSGLGSGDETRGRVRYRRRLRGDVEASDKRKPENQIDFAHAFPFRSSCGFAATAATNGPPTFHSAPRTAAGAAR